MANNTKSTKASVAVTAASTSEVKAVAAVATTEESKAYDIAYAVSLIKDIKDINASLKENDSYDDIDRISASVTYGKVSAKKASKANNNVATLGNFGYSISVKCIKKEWFIVASVQGVSLDGISVKVTKDKAGKCKLSQVSSNKDFEETSTTLRNGVSKDIFSYMKAKGLTSKDYDALIKDYATRLESRIAYAKEAMSKATAAAETTAVSA